MIDFKPTFCHPKANFQWFECAVYLDKEAEFYFNGKLLTKAELLQMGIGIPQQDMQYPTLTKYEAAGAMKSRWTELELKPVDIESAYYVCFPMEYKLSPFNDEGYLNSKMFQIECWTFKNLFSIFFCEGRVLLIIRATPNISVEDDGTRQFNLYTEFQNWKAK